MIRISFQVLFLLWTLSVGCVFAQDTTSWVIQSGETIVYEIKKLGLRVGKAIIIYQGPVQVDGREFVLIEVQSKGVKFYDNEKIYVDPKTFFPWIVDRDLNVMGQSEVIRETYDQDSGVITITKKVDGKTTEQQIRKAAPIENIYGFLFKFRQQSSATVGDVVRLSLPTKSVTMKVVERGLLSTARGEIETIHLRSSPRGYEIWFEDDARRIPLRIDGAIGFGKTAMIFKEYSRSAP